MCLPKPRRLRYQFELSALTRQLMDQEKLTTRRLAQVLHDQLGQTLTALRLTVDRDIRAGAARPDSLPELQQRQGQLSQLVNQALREVRQVLVDLRPPMLDEEGLYAALDNELASRQQVHHGVELLLEAPPGLELLRWSPDVEHALFMIAREAVDNALRHAGPSLVRVSLSGDVQSLVLEVCDDGPGLATGAERARPGHLGLIGMRERARAIDARLTLERSPEGGAQVTVRWNAMPERSP